MSKSLRVAPSLLSSDFSRLGEEIQAVEKAGADWIHIDVMDGHFVPDLTLGPPVVKKLRPVTKLPFDVHLMISHPENFIESFAQAGADYLTIHVEAVSKPLEIIKSIKSLNMKPGISLRPSTSVEALKPFLPAVDLVLVMTVEPGKGGQAFLNNQADKVRQLREMVKSLSPSPLIAVDGGITEKTAKQVALADVLVSGSFIFKSSDYALAISQLRNSVTQRESTNPV
ncbi:MAG: ribulose-phosphate 3-epimerase [Bdellovibrionales bacterium]|nr:ribulose-phosphate 3-epimerase [Bdellovibrionales bacterium]